MCKQTFHYFACNHNRITNEKCELAFDHHFFLLIACPSYSTNSFQHSDSCGIGRFYCAHHSHGETLDYAHILCAKFGEQARRCNDEIAHILEQARIFRARADNVGYPDYLRLQHPAHLQLQDLHAEVTRKHAVVKATADRTRAFIGNARSYHARLQLHERFGDGSPFPPLSFPTWMVQNLAEREESPELPAAATTYTNLGGLLIPPLGTPAQQTRVAAANVTPSTERTQAAVPSSAPARLNLHNRTRSQSNLSIVSPANTPITKKKPSRSPPKDKSAPLRRSSRTQKKPVNYAEDLDEMEMDQMISPPRESSLDSSPPLEDVFSSPPHNTNTLLEGETSQHMRYNTAPLIDQQRMRNGYPLDPNLLASPQSSSMVQYETPQTTSHFQPPRNRDPNETRATQPFLSLHSASTATIPSRRIGPVPSKSQPSLILKHTPALSPTPAPLLQPQPTSEPNKRKSSVSQDRGGKRLRLSLPGRQSQNTTPAPLWTPTPSNYTSNQLAVGEPMEEDEFTPGSPESEDSLLEEACDEWLE